MRLRPASRQTDLPCFAEVVPEWCAGSADLDLLEQSSGQHSLVAFDESVGGEEYVQGNCDASRRK